MPVTESTTCNLELVEYVVALVPQDEANHRHDCCAPGIHEATRKPRRWLWERF
jgi:hypothetical protein